MDTTTASGEFARYKRQRAREYLQAVAFADRCEKATRAEIAELDAMGLGAVDYGKAKVRKGIDREQVERIAERRAELMQVYMGDLEDALQRKADAHRALSALSQAHRELLTYHYLMGWEWRDVAREMHYSCDWCRHNSARALEELFDHIPEEMPKAV